MCGWLTFLGIPSIRPWFSWWFHCSIELCISAYTLIQVTDFANDTLDEEKDEKAVVFFYKICFIFTS